MRNPTTGAAALADLFAPVLAATEDLDSFEGALSSGIRTLAASAMAASMERFDRSLRRQVPPGWRPHEVAPRTLVTLVGEVTYRRTVYVDAHGCRRAWADELLGIRPRARLSACAFLWLARRSAEVSYRKAAAQFEAMSGARVSHVTAMRCAREEGRLLLAAEPEGPRLSCEGVRVEVDGLWVALQASSHRDAALPRFLYEQARRRSSAELKVASAYAAKAPAGNGRKRRVALSLVASAEEPGAFFARVAAQMAASFDLDDVRRVHYGADGGAWCGPERLASLLPPHARILFRLDPFHVMQAICRAFPEGRAREWARHLALKGKGAALSRMAERVAARVAGPRRERLRCLASYARRFASAIGTRAAPMGTAESTNALIAARMKGRGMAWSREGAEAMCALRCAVCSGRALIAPAKGAWLTERERAARGCSWSAACVPYASGSGWEGPRSTRQLRRACRQGPQRGVW